MQKRLAAQWTTASVDPDPAAASGPAGPEAVNLVTALRDNLQGVLDGWGDSFAGSERYERFAVAVGELEGIAETLGDIDVSWG